MHIYIYISCATCCPYSYSSTPLSPLSLPYDRADVEDALAAASFSYACCAALNCFSARDRAAAPCAWCRSGCHCTACRRNAALRADASRASAGLTPRISAAAAKLLLLVESWKPRPAIRGGPRLGRLLCPLSHKLQPVELPRGLSLEKALYKKGTRSSRVSLRTLRAAFLSLFFSIL